MHQLQEVFTNLIKNGLDRKSATSPAKWATLYRVLGGESPGPWTFNKFPWLREMHNSTAPMNIGKKAAQMGFTETVLNLTFYRLDMLSQDCLYILPTAKPAASNFSSSRVDAAVALSPHLTNLFSNIKNSQHKRAGSADLFIRGSRSRTDLKSDPINFLVFDELDEMNQDLVTLGELRCSGQENYQIWKISTPTVANKKIDLEYTHSTQEHFIFPCPICSKLIEMIFPESIIIRGESHRDPECNKSRYICTECKGILPQESKKDYISKGQWVPFGSKDIDTRGFYINQLYSYIRSPGDIAKAWLEGQIKPSAEQEFYNSRLGLPFVAEGTQVSSKDVFECVKDYVSGPQDGLITMGIDIGRNKHYYVILKWDVNYGLEINTTSKPTLLKAGEASGYPELESLMHEYQVLMAVLDSQPEYQKTLEFCLKFSPHAKMCTYNTNRASNILLKIPDPYTPNITVNRTLWLETALTKILNKTISLPRDIPSDFEKHLQNIFKRYGEDQYGNETSWYESTDSDHYAHALTYAEIALPLAAAHTTNKSIEAFL